MLQEFHANITATKLQSTMYQCPPPPPPPLPPLPPDDSIEPIRNDVTNLTGLGKFFPSLARSKLNNQHQFSFGIWQNQSKNECLYVVCIVCAGVCVCVCVQGGEGGEEGGECVMKNVYLSCPVCPDCVCAVCPDCVCPKTVCPECEVYKVDKGWDIFGKVCLFLTVCGGFQIIMWGRKLYLKRQQIKIWGEKLIKKLCVRGLEEGEGGGCVWMDR